MSCAVPWARRVSMWWRTPVAASEVGLKVISAYSCIRAQTTMRGKKIRKDSGPQRNHKYTHLSSQRNHKYTHLRKNKFLTYKNVPKWKDLLTLYSMGQLVFKDIPFSWTQSVLHVCVYDKSGRVCATASLGWEMTQWLNGLWDWFQVELFWIIEGSN